MRRDLNARFDELKRREGNTACHSEFSGGVNANDRGLSRGSGRDPQPLKGESSI